MNSSNEIEIPARLTTSREALLVKILVDLYQLEAKVDQEHWRIYNEQLKLALQTAQLVQFQEGVADKFKQVVGRLKESVTRLEKQTTDISQSLQRQSVVAQPWLGECKRMLDAHAKTVEGLIANQQTQADKSWGLPMSALALSGIFAIGTGLGMFVMRLIHG